MGEISNISNRMSVCSLFIYRSHASKGGGDGDLMVEQQGPKPHTTRNHPSIPLTGDTKADADIIAFYKARQKLIRELK